MRDQWSCPPGTGFPGEESGGQGQHRLPDGTVQKSRSCKADGLRVTTMPQRLVLVPVQFQCGQLGATSPSCEWHQCLSLQHEQLRCSFEAKRLVLWSLGTRQLPVSPGFCPLLGAVRGASMRGATHLTCGGFAGCHFGLSCLSKNNLKWRSEDQN